MPKRIVSLAPGITETLYALGLGDKIAGVTRFCLWPQDAATKPAVGGFREINLEAIARVKPDLVILPDDMRHFARQIEAIGAPALFFNIRALAGFRRDLEILGAICGREAEAAQLAAAFDASIGQSQMPSSGKEALFLLMSPDECSRPASEFTAIGQDGFYNDLMRAAGLQNSYKGGFPYARLSREAIVKMNPDVLIVAASACKDLRLVKANLENLGNLKAVENGDLLLLADPGDTIPGPRALRTLQKIRDLMERGK